MKILLVDDEIELISALAERLSFRGIDADWTDNGDQAIELARENDYEVAVLDVKMPGMSGLELREHLKAIKPEMRFVFLSGHGSEQDFREGSAKASSYLIKPINIDELIERVKNA
ncbi:response regulator [Salidesulfovibrio brasiliensis]|uniref:response regulator n=1 Tax=Salidesulfovibrio brasiliensis TaxID=221711 RepID=UPI0006D0C3A4|nr:response regulator [Salidesulfovibrio brasiliensis]